MNHIAVLVCHDLSAHRIFKASPQVAGPPGFRFYAGAPIVLANGFRVGSVCLMDYEARSEFDDRDEEILKDFASIVVDELELHRQIAVGCEALMSAEHTADEAMYVNGEVLNFLRTSVNLPLSAIGEHSERLIERLESDRPDCAKLASAIKESAARLAREARRLAGNEAG